MARPKSWGKAGTPEGDKAEHKFMKTVKVNGGGNLSSFHKSYDRHAKSKALKKRIK